MNNQPEPPEEIWYQPDGDSEYWEPCLKNKTAHNDVKYIRSDLVPDPEETRKKCVYTPAEPDWMMIPYETSCGERTQPESDEASWNVCPYCESPIKILDSEEEENE